MRERLAVRAATGAPTVTASSRLVMRSAAGLAAEFEAASLDPRPALERAVSELAELEASLPEVSSPSPLLLELGTTLTGIGSAGGDLAWRREEYRLVKWRGTVAELGMASTPPRPLPWSASLAAAELDLDAPLLLGPSAVLALFAFCLEVSAVAVEAPPLAAAAGLRLVDTARSPYPPQHHPFDEVGGAAHEEVLFDGGWRARSEKAGDDVDPLFLLATRPERALRPLAAAMHFNRRNLALDCAARVEAPGSAVIVDSWRVRVGPRRGAVPFEAELSRRAASSELAAVAGTVMLRLDPFAVVAALTGAPGPAAAAVDEDPIEGDSFGWAPPLATALTLRDLAPAFDSPA